MEDVFQDTFMVSAETVMTHLYRALKWLSGMAENQLTVLQNYSLMKSMSVENDISEAYLL